MSRTSSIETRSTCGPVGRLAATAASVALGRGRDRPSGPCEPRGGEPSVRGNRRQDRDRAPRVPGARPRHLHGADHDHGPDASHDPGHGPELVGDPAQGPDRRVVPDRGPQLVRRVPAAVARDPAPDQLGSAAAGAGRGRSIPPPTKGLSFPRPLVHEPLPGGAREVRGRCRALIGFLLSPRMIDPLDDRSMTPEDGGMRRVLWLVLILTLLAPLALAVAASLDDEKLPTDPALVMGRLPNGLRYVIRPHQNPQGRVSIWLHVASGSLNETDSTRGLAHYLEHMAFNGSANFPPGSAVPFFQSLGLAFGRDQNAFTSFDQTTYQLALPGGGRDVVDKGMLFMSDVAMRLSLEPSAIDSERQVILEEKRARSSAQQRIQDQVYPRLAPESTVGRRLPIGSETTIKSVTPADFRDYYARWYVPSNMTVIVVGDTDPAMVIDAITRHFGGGPTAPEPTPRDVGVKPSAGPRAIVATDPELTRAEVSIVRPDPPRAPTTTAGQSRHELVETMGTWAFNRRMSARIAAGGTAFLAAHASIRDWPSSLRMTTVAASGRPGTWRAMLSELGTELQRARLHGFTDAEMQDARTMLIADAEETVRRETTRPAREVLREINEDVTRGTPTMSADQNLALLKRLLPGITAREVSDIFAVNFDPTRALTLVELPSSDTVPGEPELLVLGRAAVDVKPDKLPEVPRATTLLATLPTPGTVVETVPHAASGVTSMWLDN